ncbi:MAG: peptide chain release factor N(5)-glutamine methyltransferase [Bacteroidota bacterium]
MSLKTPKSLKEVWTQLWEALMPIYEEQEVKTISKWALEHISGHSWQHMLIHEEVFSPENLQQLEEIRGRLLKGEPIQYVLEEAHFYGRIFSVRPGVLIPRRETEELVEWVLADLIPDLAHVPSILDIGTGTGCIPISLERELTKKTLVSYVRGVDISETALEVARENVETLGAKVGLGQLDIFQADKASFAELDALVSNPPYVPISDKAEMHINVTEYEPEQALFVEDDDPLIFYKRIAQLGLHWLKSGGKLYFEVYADYALQVKQMMEVVGYKEVTVKKDMQGRDRMLRGIK